jgi:prevent-host-death family protein
MRLSLEVEEEVMKTVNVHEAKTHLSRLLARVHAGEEIVIAKAGKPYARLVPLAQTKKRRPGIAQGAVTEVFFEPLPEDELQAWEK